MCTYRYATVNPTITCKFIIKNMEKFKKKISN